jgi:hypothetical protein
MSLWTLVKLLAALAVMAVMAVTAMLAWHVAIEPLGGVFNRLIPEPGGVLRKHDDAQLVKMLESPEMPDIDPGEKAFQKAHELLALGKLPEAREKFTAIVNVFPTSSSAPAARRIVGEMNLDEILSATHMQGKQLHVVKRGEALLSIAARYRTTIECILHLNSMMELRNIQPGDELVVLPLDFRLLIEPRRMALSIWDGGRFIREYPVRRADGVPHTPQRGTIAAKTAELDGRPVKPQTREWHAAEKIIRLSKPAIQIRGWNGSAEDAAPGILLRPQDMEEIILLTRPGNEVEIR